MFSMTCITFTIHSPKSDSFVRSLTWKVTLKSVSMALKPQRFHRPACNFPQRRRRWPGLQVEALGLRLESCWKVQVNPGLPIDNHNLEGSVGWQGYSRR